MSFAPIALTIPQYEDYPNYWLKAYEEGTVTPLVMATDATGGTTVAKFEIDAQGFPKTSGGTRLIPFIDGDYDLWLFPTAAEADANDTTNAIQFADKLNADPLASESTLDIFDAWDTTVSYSLNAIVTGSDTLYYRSLVSSNQGNDPISDATRWEQLKFNLVWNAVPTYASGDTVYGSDGLLYISRIGSNQGNDPISDDANWRLLNDSPGLLNNAGFTAAVATKVLTFALKTNDLTDPTATDKVVFSFRSSTLTSGQYDVVGAVAATSIVVPDGATLGFSAAATGFVYLYALNNAGTVELSVCGQLLDEAVLHTTVAISATADSASVLYSTTLRSNVPIRLMGRIKIETGAVAGEWDNAPTELYVGNSGVVTDGFISTEQTITTAGPLTLAHGLGSKPNLLQLRLICKTTDAGYAVGEEVIIGSSHTSSAASNGFGISVILGTTNISIRYGAAASVFYLNNKGTGSGVNLTNSSWRLIVRAWV